MLQDKLDFLNKYTLSKKLSVSLIGPNDIDNIQKDLIPDEWRGIFKEKDKSIRISEILNVWKRYVSSEMSNTIYFLNEFLIDVELMAIG
ncbi:SMI1/KNR4 family protein, partial [Priestia megaterium]